MAGERRDGWIEDALFTSKARADDYSPGPIARPWNETLQVSLWLVDRAGTHLTSWAMTDRLHLERATIEPVALDEYSRWVAVRAFCLGTPIAEAPNVYASRWRFLRGTPLIILDDRCGRVAARRRADRLAVHGRPAADRP